MEAFFPHFLSLGQKNQKKMKPIYLGVLGRTAPKMTQNLEFEVFGVNNGIEGGDRETVAHQLFAGWA